MHCATTKGDNWPFPVVLPNLTQKQIAKSEKQILMEKVSEAPTALI